jgi:hypothetical protein
MLIFYSRLNFASKQLIDASSGGSTSTKTQEKLYERIENTAMNHHSWGNQRIRARTSGMHSTDAMASLKAKLEALAKKIEKMSVTPQAKTQVLWCNFCGGNHPNHKSQSVGSSKEHAMG